MNIFLDLEATEKKREIISIGAIKANGETFYTLVKPEHIQDVTKRIENLTGITKDMLSSLQNKFNIEVQMNLFWNWCKQDVKDVRNIHIFSYGHYDKQLIEIGYERSRKKCFLSVSCRIADFAKVANKIVYGDLQTRSLIKITNDVTGLQETQNHNSLDDAKLLKELYEGLSMRNIGIQNFRDFEEEYFLFSVLNSFKKHGYIKYHGNKRFKTLTQYLKRLSNIEIDTLEYRDIRKYLKDSTVVEDKIKEDFFNFFGRKYRGKIYEKKRV